MVTGLLARLITVLRECLSLCILRRLPSAVLPSFRLHQETADPRLKLNSTSLPDLTANCCDSTALLIRSPMAAAMLVEAIGMMATNSSPA